MKKENRRDFLRKTAIAGSMMIMPGVSASFASAGSRNSFEKSETLSDPYELLDEDAFIDVTKAPFFADPTGNSDSTKALQTALDESRNSRRICFFPSGTYLISDTLSCEQRVAKADRSRHTDTMRQSWWDLRDNYYVLGSTKNGRPVIKLSPDAKGFDNPSKPKYACWIWAQTRNDYPGTHQPVFGMEQANISFGHIFRGIDFDVSGHPGAIGLRFAGSQGTLLMDCTVKADGALAGFNDCPGQGGGTYNISTIGGRFGLIIDSSYRFPMLAGCSFKGQTEAPVVYTSGNLPLMMVGCYFESNGPSAIDVTRLNQFPGVSLVDCQIKMNNGGTVLNQSHSQNLLLENVYIRGAQYLQNTSVTVPSPEKWTEVKRYSSCSDFSQNLINGKKSNENYLEWNTISEVPSMDQLHENHWRTLPSFEDNDAVSIKDFGAKGDGEADDTAAFKRALGESKKVYFPPGNYTITESIKLEPGVQLFGIRNASISIPTLTTHNSVKDDTFLSFITVRGNLEWGSGKGIMAFARGGMKFTKNGGGRFYAMRGIGRGNQALFEGTRQPISLYTLNIERRRTNPQSYIKDVKHFRIFYLKAEASITGWGVDLQTDLGNTPLAIWDSEDVRVYCACGNVVTSDQRPFIEVVDSNNVLISQVKSFRTGDFPQIRESFKGKVQEIPTTKTMSLFIRD